MLQTKVCTGTSVLPLLFDDFTSPILLSDTRQRAGKHNNILTAAARRDIEVRPAVLPVGDYQLMTPSGVVTAGTVDTKRGVQELQQNLVLDRERVAREMDRARSLGMRLAFVVEVDVEGDVTCVGDASSETTLCDVCPYAKTCPHLGECAQHGVAYDFSDPVRSLRDFANFARAHGAAVVLCGVEDTGDVVVGLLSTEGATRCVVI